MPKNLVRIAVLLLGIAISAVSLYFAFQGFDLQKVWDATARVRPEFLLLLVVPYVVTFLTKVWRWRVMFHPDEQKVRFGVLFWSLMISYVPLPFRMGEVARAVVAGSRSSMPVARVFSTIVVEKVLDVLTLLLFLGACLPFVELPAGTQGSAMIVAAAVIALTLVLFAMVLRPDLTRRMVRVITRPLPAGLATRLIAIADQALLGLAPLSRPGVAARLGLWSLATWSINAVAVYCMLLAFNVNVTPVAGVVLVVATNLSMAIPSAPGYVGPFELAVVAVLKVLGVQEAQAQSFAIIYHFIGLVPVAILGLIGVVQLGVGMAAFRSRPADEEAGEGAARPVATQAAPAPRNKTARDEPC